MATTSSGSDRLLPVAGGEPLPESVMVWLAQVGDRLTFSVASGLFRVGPRAALTTDDAAFIRAHKPDIVRALAYCDALGPLRGMTEESQ